MSSGSSQKPTRQDYIAKVRYTNNLPPPPLNPKFIKYNTSELTNSKNEGENLISSLFRKENFQNLLGQIDEFYGMGLNLIDNSGFLDLGNDSIISGGNNNIQLHGKDRVLLRDAGIGKISKSEPGVSFLRRTEYMSEETRPSSKNVVEQKKKVGLGEEKIDADSQLRAVEDTFDKAQESLDNFENIRHPKRKNLKAVDVWPLLPDTSMMDNKFLLVKFIGSASLNREIENMKRVQPKKYNEEYVKNSLETSIFKPITSDDGEWISLFQVKDEAKAQELNTRLNSTERERPVNLLDDSEEVEPEEYKFKYVKNYDMKFQRNKRELEELGLKFISEPDNKKRKVGFYYPISGKIDLKKHRTSTNSEINRFLRDSTLDGINFKLREPTTNELKRMDNVRSEFDPMEYEGEEEEEQEEEGQEEDEEDED
ncbi:RNA polymerase II-associated protein 1 [Spathaspora sp. JA1]|nr:RNA polymerase II-associated protein 1 [Spathaspora sp. JA1]